MSKPVIRYGWLGEPAGEGKRLLEVRDNGVGLPEDRRDGGFGMTLMESIARLEGWRLTICSDGGTVFRLVF